MGLAWEPPPGTHHFWGTYFSKSSGRPAGSCGLRALTLPVTAPHKRFSHPHSLEAPSGVEGHVTQENGPNRPLPFPSPPRGSLLLSAVGRRCKSAKAMTKRQSPPQPNTCKRKVPKPDADNKDTRIRTGDAQGAVCNTAETSFLRPLHTRVLSAPRGASQRRKSPQQGQKEQQSSEPRAQDNSHLQTTKSFPPAVPALSLSSEQDKMYLANTSPHRVTKHS